MSEVNSIPTINFVNTDDTTSLEQTYLSETDLGMHGDEDDSSKQYNYIKFIQNDSILQVSSADFIDASVNSKSNLDHSNDGNFNMSPYWKKPKDSSSDEIFKDNAQFITQVNNDSNKNKSSPTAITKLPNPLLTSNIKVEFPSHKSDQSKESNQPIYLIAHVESSDQAFINSLTSTSWNDQSIKKNFNSLSNKSLDLDENASK